jgi:hypothetical protein
MKTMGEWSSTILDLGTGYRSGQLHAPGFIPGEKTLINIGREAGSAPEPFWMPWRSEICLAPARNRTLAIQPVAIPIFQCLFFFPNLITFPTACHHSFPYLLVFFPYIFKPVSPCLISLLKLYHSSVVFLHIV